jgi:EmrB/QacA subfamily drug resistance transporter
MAQPSESARGKHVALFVATISAFITPFLGSSVNVALPTIGREFAMDAISLSWISTAYLLASTITLLPGGRLADIYGRKRLWLCGIVLYTACSLLCAAAPSGIWLIVGRGLQAIGGGLIYGTGVAIVTSVYPREERGKALGINVAAVYSGLSVGPLLGGLLTAQWGWRSIFLATVPLGIVAVGLILWQLRGEWAEARGERFDLVGSALYALALVLGMYGVTLLPEQAGVGLLLAGAVGLLLFGWWELRAPQPVLDLRLFKGNPVFAFSNLAALLNYSATSGVIFLLSLYLQYVQGLSPSQAGVILLAQPAMMTLLSLVAGRLSDRLEPRLLSSAGMGLTAVGLFALASLGETTTLWFIGAALLLVGTGFGLFSSPNTNAAMSAVDRRFYGVASGTLGTMRQSGQMTSMAIVMTVFAIHLGRAPIGAENHPAFVLSVQTAFAVFGVLCCGGVLASLVRGKVRDRETESARAGTA